LPHEEPLSADGGEGEEPEHEADGEGEGSGAFGGGEGGGGGVAGAEERDGSGPSEEGAEGFPEDDADVEGDVDGRGYDGSPSGVAVGEGGVHGEDVADELVVGVEVGDVGEGDKCEEERDRGEEKDLSPTGSGLGGGWKHVGILAGGEEDGSRLRANAHISESRYGAPDLVERVRCGPPACQWCVNIRA
jgi:hypothetical protein